MKDLFEGLWLLEKWDWDWKPHPVILLDFNGVSLDTPENLKLGLQRRLAKIAEAYGVASDAPLLKEQFQELIVSLRRKCGMPVAVLIDEYDKPLVDHLEKGEAGLATARANRDILKYFFGVLKESEVSSALRFVFVAGVSKFSRVSIFSELNNLTDITMHDRYAEMFGYTQSELETCFASYIERFAEKTGHTAENVLEKLARHYDGYRFSQKNIRIYNPFSVLRALDENTFKNYWFETGTPTFLVNLLKERNYPMAKIEDLKMQEEFFSVCDIDRLQPEALFFQTGYITIKDFKGDTYSFRYPNQEVKIFFLKFLLFSHIPANAPEQDPFHRSCGLFEQRRLQRIFRNRVRHFRVHPLHPGEQERRGLFSHRFFPDRQPVGNRRPQRGADQRRQDRHGHGIQGQNTHHRIQVCDQSADTAIRQIREKGYDAQFKPKGKKIVLVGINFDSKKRNVAEWKIV